MKKAICFVLVLTTLLILSCNNQKQVVVKKHCAFGFHDSIYKIIGEGSEYAFRDDLL